MDKKEKAKRRREKPPRSLSSAPFPIPITKGALMTEMGNVRWWTSETIAVVTGANRGIGFEIVHQLALHGLTVVLTSRDTGVGEEAAKVLQEGGLNVVFHQLDIVDPSSIEAFTEWIKENYGGIDILRIENDEVRKKLQDDEALSEELIDQIMDTFLEQVKDGSWTDGGWPQVFTDYSLSKLAVNAYTRLMARIFSERPEGQKIYINCYCPGWVKTAMTGWAGHVSPEDGADTAVWLALLPEQFITGKFFSERREIHF
ncbi:UNVERIFIED_CONTAM: Carbonyl reductase [NADPH] 1 [Sesamum radiatum]|uniref:Carbonyl reductase [NADPH] 1 n=1 Tax=Sesamum radiatum TaxID=300843 RepID=A0AAW2PF58_SESRA